MDFDLNAHDAVLPAGRVLGLVLTLSDTQYTERASAGATVRVDLSRSGPGLPVVPSPGATALPDATVAPTVSAPAPRVHAEEPGREYGLIPRG